jgi:ATP-dependent protease ClpP protease subunit
MITDTAVSPEREAAEIAKLEAEAAQARANASKSLADAACAHWQSEMARYEARKSEMFLADVKRANERVYAQDKYNHTYRFLGVVDEHAVKDAIDELTVWDRLDPVCPIELIFNSPGGSAIDGMDLFDFVQELRAKGHYVTTAARGYAASMGGILLQAGDLRVMGREAYVLIHQVSAGIVGKIGDIKDEMIFLNKMSERIISIFADRAAQAGRAGTASQPLTRRQIANGWERKDWWLDSGECLKYGLVDAVR